jgi:hypothetical protein
MTDLLLVLVLIEVALVGYQTGRIWKKLNSGEEQRVLEDNVQRAMDRMVEEVEKAKDHVASKDGIGSMDQGFENIMTYQVSLGRGRMSEGEPWNV